MHCQVCQANARDGVRFCTQCGAPLYAFCPRCQFPREADDRWCGGCGLSLAYFAAGTPLPAAPSPVSGGVAQTAATASSGPLSSERKNVTVLFADISGFTAMSEKLDPEEVTALMNGCMALLAKEVIRYEGYVDKFIGDCIMALFGAPVAHENDPELAVRAALGMVRVMEEYNRTLPIRLERPLSLHIGINTGIVIAGGMGSDEKMQYTVMGDTVNLASRLESLATGGETLISGYTYNLVRHIFECQQREPVKVKGKQDPVSVYLVSGERKEGSRERRRDANVPLVGREREIAAISACYHRFRDGEGQVLFLISDPGIGKSRVEEESRSLFQEEEIQTYRVICRSFARSTSYYPYTELFRSLLSVDLGDLPEAVGRKVAEGLPALLRLDAAALPGEAREAMVFIATLLGGDLGDSYGPSLAGMPAQEIKAATFRSVSWFMERFAAQRPLVLVLEDMHHADPTSVELTAHLFKLAARARLMMLLLLRPGKDYPAGKLQTVAQKQLGRQSTEIFFSLLSSDECDQLARVLLDSNQVPEEVLRLIRERSEGNPLFIEEIIRTLVDEKVVARDEDGVVQVVRDLTRAGIPTGIYGIISARIDHLPPNLKELLGVAAVIGPVFSLRLLRVLAPANNLEDTLEQLSVQELIFESQTFPEIEYSFHSALIQEIVYATLLLQKRRALHGRVAEALETLHAGALEEHAALLAHHFAQAGRVDRAFPYLASSGLRAKQAFANEEALHHFTQALELARQLPNPEPSMAALYHHLAEVQELLGQLPEAIESYRAALEGCASGEERAECHRLIGRIQEKRGLKEESLAAYEAGFAALEGQPAPLVRGRLLMNQSWVLNRHRLFDEALAKGREALHLFEEQNSLEDQAQALNNLAVYHEHSGDLDQALRENQRSLEIFASLGDKRQLANVHLSLGYVLNRRGENDEALSHFARSCELMERLGNRYGAGAALLAKGRVYMDLNRLDDAEQALLQALRFHREVEVGKKVVANQLALAKVCHLKQDWQEALRHLGDAQALALQEGYTSDLAKAKQMEGSLQAACGQDPRPALEEAQRLFLALGRAREAEAVARELAKCGGV